MFFGFSSVTVKGKSEVRTLVFNHGGGGCSESSALQLLACSLGLFTKICGPTPIGEGTGNSMIYQILYIISINNKIIPSLFAFRLVFSM